MHNFKELKVWQKSRELAKLVYCIELPNEEKYGLTSQIRRSVVSISSNIAEGSSRKSNIDFIRFLNISLGSAYELETQLILCLDLQLIKNIEAQEILENLSEAQKMIHGLIKSLNPQLNNITRKSIKS